MYHWNMGAKKLCLQQPTLVILNIFFIPILLSMQDANLKITLLFVIFAILLYFPSNLRNESLSITKNEYNSLEIHRLNLILRKHQRLAPQIAA